MLDKQFRAAEEVYLQTGDVGSAIKMYEQFCMYEEGNKLVIALYDVND